MKETSTVKLWSKNFVFIILINFLVFLNHIMLVSTFPFYIAKLGGSEAVSGTAATLFSLVAVIFRPFIGWMLDNGKRKAILIIGLCGMAVTPIGYLIFSVVYMALVCRMLHGASLAYFNTSTATIASDIIPQSRFAEGMGFFGIATALATACAPAFGLAIMDKMGFETLFLCATGSILIAFILLFLLKTPVIETVKKPFSLKGLVDKNALPASAVTVIFMLTFGALENFLSKYAADHGLPSGGIYFAIMSVMLFLTRISVGKIADREGEEIFVYTCNASMLSALLLLSFTHTTLSFVLSAVLAGYAFGGLEPALQSMAIHIAPPEKRGSANSTFLCAYGIGLGGGVAGWLIAGSGYHIMWFALSMANIVSVVVYLIFGRSHPSSFHYKKHT
ncbi:MAG: MFS transporter [Clostridia bacterium]|nr:MFS transporter [Clostridia bacterium]